jgi:hypothetical protein
LADIEILERFAIAAYRAIDVTANNDILGFSYTGVSDGQQDIIVLANAYGIYQYRAAVAAGDVGLHFGSEMRLGFLVNVCRVTWKIRPWFILVVRLNFLNGDFDCVGLQVATVLAHALNDPGDYCRAAGTDLFYPYRSRLSRTVYGNWEWRGM